MTQPRGTTTTSGLGWQHQKRRRGLLAQHVDGTPCAVCGQPMYRLQALDADHTQPRALGGRAADRLLHATCNRSRGDGTRTPTSHAPPLEPASPRTTREW